MGIYSEKCVLIGSIEMMKWLQGIAGLREGSFKLGVSVYVIGMVHQ